MNRSLGGLLLVLAAASAQAANFISGERLYSMMTGNDPYARAQASGYIAGVTDANTGLGPNALKWCYDVPTGTPTTQTFEIVKQFLEKNAAKRKLGAAGLVEEALSGAFPCRK